MPQMKLSKRLFRIVALNVLVLFCGIGLAEIIFGAWIFGPDYGTMNIPRGSLHVFDVSDLYGKSEKIRYSRDENGLRGRYGSLSDIDILTMGGSTSNQLYIDDNETWQAVLAARFEDGGKAKTVVDAAVDGQSTRGHIAVFDQWFPLLPRLKARYVLVYAGINDVHIEIAQQQDSMQAPELSRRIRYYVMNKSAVYGLFRTVRGMFKAWNAKLIHGGEKIEGVSWARGASVNDPLPSSDPSLVAGLEAYRQRLRVLTGKIRRFGARPVFVTQTMAGFRIRDGQVFGVLGREGQVVLSDYFEIMPFNLVTLDVCRKVGAICIDLARELEFDDGDFYDKVHNTPSGSKKIGDYLYENLKSLL